MLTEKYLRRTLITYRIAAFALLAIVSVVLSFETRATITGGEVTGDTAFNNGGTFVKLTVPLNNPYGPPNSIGIDNYDSWNLYAFDEAQNAIVTQLTPLVGNPLTYEDCNPGNWAVFFGFCLENGSTVASHYIAYDPPGQGLQWMEGYIDFDSKIIAVMTRVATLETSDYLANTGVNYLGNELRGIETNWGDEYSIVEGPAGPYTRITMRIGASTPGDYFRVITEFSPGAESQDTDNDGVNDDLDNCIDVANEDQLDLDSDGLGDVCDPDADNDDDPATTDCNDMDPAIYTGAIEICSDGIDNNCNGLVDLSDTAGDCDGDNVLNDIDNCPSVSNPGQLDTDFDSLGDVCDNDDDNDGVLDDADNCQLVSNSYQGDFDNDGVGDVCDSDSDGDGVDNVTDRCLSTPRSDVDAGVPSLRLGKNRWADVDGDGVFDTSGRNPTGRSYTISDTAGCSCAQIIAECGYGEGHTKFGCSNSVMDWWTGSHDRDGHAPYQCKED